VITFIDQGKPYDPLEKEDPDLDQTASQTVGGLGIFMVKKSMDHIAYEYIDGQNVLTIQKNI
jgi:anti-sigma regulatory factor (Ser/Thr protein kinase)